MKKILSTLMILTLVLSLAAPVFAEEAEGTLSPAERAKVLKLLENYQNIMDIPSDTADLYIESDSYYYEENVYSISWYADPCWYDVYMDDKGNLLQVAIDSYNSYDSNRKLLTGGLSKEQGQAIAESWLGKIYPSLFKDLRLTHVQSHSYSWEYTYTLFKGDIEVSYAYAIIEVNKYDENTFAFEAEPLAEIVKSTFPAANAVIGEEKAKSIFRENSSAILSYWDEGLISGSDRVAIPQYDFFFQHRYLDAVTAQPVEKYNPYSGYYQEYYSLEDYEDQLEWMIEEDYVGWFAEDLEGVTGLISQNQAEKAARSKIPQITSSSSLKLAYCLDYYVDSNYIWCLFFDTLSVQIDAMTGDLIGFTDFTAPATSGKITQEEAQKIATQFIMKDQPGSAAQVQLYPSPYEEMYRENSYQFYYVQYVNDLPFFSNYFIILVDKAGKITDYYFSWEENTSFPKVSGQISSQEALDLFLSECTLNLMYIQKQDETPALVYGLQDLIFYRLDAYTGEKIHPFGEMYETTDAVGYTDISGKWYEEIVQVLYDNGYTIDNNAEFNGKSQITQAEFLRFLYADELYWYEDHEIYEYLLAEGILLESEISPGEHLTRQDAAKFAVCYLGYGELAQDSAIFKNVYADWVDPSYAGYAAATKSLGLMNGDKNGNFNGTQIMTRAEAAVLIYNTLMAY